MSSGCCFSFLNSDCLWLDSFASLEEKIQPNEHRHKCVCVHTHTRAKLASLANALASLVRYALVSWSSLGNVQLIMLTGKPNFSNRIISFLILMLEMHIDNVIQSFFLLGSWTVHRTT